MNDRKTMAAPICRSGRTAAIFCMGIILLITSRPSQAQRTQASPLPLSGRAGESGSVTAVETPIAGTTNSAELDVSNSVFAHNLAKLSIARSIASAADDLQQFPRPCLWCRCTPRVAGVAGQK